MQTHWCNCTSYSVIRLNLQGCVPFSNPSCPLRFYQYSGDRASHYAAPTTLALSLLVTDRPAIVPATVQCALTLNSLAGRLPASASSGNTRRLSSHEGNLESTCHWQWQTTRSPWNPRPKLLLCLLTALYANERKYDIKRKCMYSHNLMPGLDVDSQYLKWDFFKLILSHIACITEDSKISYHFYIMVSFLLYYILNAW